jgi:hypothetical protein
MSIWKSRKTRVEEDLERIRRANLPSEKQEEDHLKKINSGESTEKLKLEKNDLLAMILAVLSLIVPYILIFAAAMGSIVFLIYKFL